MALLPVLGKWEEGRRSLRPGRAGGDPFPDPPFIWETSGASARISHVLDESVRLGASAWGQARPPALSESGESALRPGASAWASSREKHKEVDSGASAWASPFAGRVRPEVSGASAWASRSRASPPWIGSGMP